MSEGTSHTVLFFRTYREVTVPFYASLLATLRASPDLPFELATTLEDIGQEFMRFAGEVNEELLRRGVLAYEADHDQTVDAHIDGVLRFLVECVGQAQPTAQLATALDEPAVRQALKTGFLMVRDLPVMRPLRQLQRT